MNSFVSSGIYAFRCAQADQLFNVLQESIQMSSSANFTSQHAPEHAATTTGAPPATVTAALPGTTPLPHENGTRCVTRVSSPPHNYANDVRPYINSPFYVNTNQSGAGGTQGGRALPAATAVQSQTLPTSETNTDINTNYARIDYLVSYYANVVTPTAGTTTNATLPPSSSPPPTPADEHNQPTDKPTHDNNNSSPPRTPTGGKSPVAGTPVPPPDTPPPARPAAKAKAPPPLPTQLVNNASYLVPPPRTPTGDERDEPMNYIMLDMDNSSSSFVAGGGAHIVTTAPVSN